MRPTARVPLALLAGLAVGPNVAGLVAQSATQTHIGHILTGFPSAPNGAALLAVAEADAALAVEHARLAGRNQTDVGPMVQHSRHVMQILDPAAWANGPGSGMGVGPAARAIAQHVEMAAQDAADGVRTHAGHVAAAASAVDARTTEMIALARRIVATSDYVEAYDLVLRLQVLAGELGAGADASGDGQIAVAEGGLEHIRTHMELLSAAAGP
jgi:hypothetical protein